MNKFFKALLVLVASFCLAVPAMVPAVSIDNPLSSNSIEALLTRIFNTVAGIVGTLGIIMLIVAGVLFVTSAGSPEKVNSAKKALFYAVVGIAVSLAATAIANTVKYIIGA